jgi:uncharacterized protein YgbK (DUF1537 family)
MRDYLLADDLSGALDAAAAFHRAGRRVRIVWSREAWEAAAPDTFVAYTTETRNSDPATAAAQVGAVIAHAQCLGAKLCFKKIDSTLRGPVAAELGAVAAALPEARFLFAPANPAVGRTVRVGCLLVRGVPVAETEFARDPLSPVRESALRAFVGAIVGERIVIPDTETTADFAASVVRMEAGGPNWIPVGSGALARAVAERSARPAMARNDPPATVAAGPILLVCGSAHPLNRAQAEELHRQRRVPICELRIEDIAGTVRAAVDSLGRSGSVSLVVSATRTDSSVALRAIAEATAQIVAEAKVRRLFVTGGESAFAICRALAIPALDLMAELEPGVCLAHAVTREGGRLLAVKPGGFGGTATWVRVWDTLRET